MEKSDFHRHKLRTWPGSPPTTTCKLN